jgi:hypothetical protein
MGLSFLALPLLAGCVLSGGHSQRPADEPAIGSGFDRFYNNDYAGAIKQFEAAVKAAPDDPESYNHLAQGILYETLFRTGTLGSHLVTDANEFLHRSKIPISPENKKRFADVSKKRSG